MISIVTPSLDQGRYLEAAIDSVLGQAAEVEYVVVDGGSQDGSAEILRRYEGRLAASVSEPDEGQYDALEKGFALTRGEIMGWLNADDFYLPGALSVVEEVFAGHPEIEWLTSVIAVTANERGQVFATRDAGRFSRRAFLRGFNLPRPDRHTGFFIPQESTFWRRSLWERAGARFDRRFGLAGDFELWGRFYEHAELWGVRAFLGVYRMQPRQKTALAFADYLREAEQALAERAGAHYGGVEGRMRGWLGRAEGSAWRVPRVVRRPLERAHVLHRTPELVWLQGRGWVESTRFFV